MELRDYQNEAISAVQSKWREGLKKLLVILPTGCGKTVVFAKMTELAHERNNNILILAHRGELLEQAQDKLKRVTGISSSIEKADFTGVGARVVIGSMQTLCRKNRLEAYPSDYFKFIVIDECHHVLTPSYRRILEHFNSAYVVGVTATPDRGDQKGLIYDAEDNKQGFFDAIAYEYSIVNAVRNGYLARPKTLRVPIKLDLRKIHIKQGDYDQNEVFEVLKDNLYKIAEAMQQHCSDRKTVVFMPLVNSSKLFANILNEYGFKAIEVNGNTVDRAERLRDFANGKYNVICNAMLLTEGWDCPDVDCVIVLRPTKVRALYQQMVGRGMRLAEGKKDCLLLDFLWLSDKHDLCSPASMIATNKKNNKKINLMIDESDQVLDLIELEEKVKKDNNNSMNKELEENSNKKLEEYDPIFSSISFGNDLIDDWTPKSVDDLLPITDAQKEALKKLGFSDVVKTKGLACEVIKRCKKRVELGLCTVKMVKFLRKYKFVYADIMAYEDGRDMISYIKSNKYHVPAWVDTTTYGGF